MFTDLRGGPARTWPYGTQKTVSIKSVEKTQHKGNIVTVIVAIERLPSGNEGHIIIGGAHEIEPSAGDAAVMQFTRGGPTGGYWRLISFAE